MVTNVDPAMIPESDTVAVPGTPSHPTGFAVATPSPASSRRCHREHPYSDHIILERLSKEVNTCQAKEDYTTIAINQRRRPS